MGVPPPPKRRRQSLPSREGGAGRPSRKSRDGRRVCGRLSVKQNLGRGINQINTVTGQQPCSYAPTRSMPGRASKETSYQCSNGMGSKRGSARAVPPGWGGVGPAAPKGTGAPARGQAQALPGRKQASSHLSTQARQEHPDGGSASASASRWPHCSPQLPTGPPVGQPIGWPRRAAPPGGKLALHAAGPAPRRGARPRFSTVSAVHLRAA